MYDGMKLYRAVVAASSPSTGAVYVSIPSVLGPTTTIGVSTIGRGPVNGVWEVPSVGDQVVVAVEDDKFSNIYLITQGTPTAVTSLITDSDISNSAAISLSKLATGALPTGITVTTNNIVNLSVTNSDISSTAGVSLSKLQSITPGSVVIGSSGSSPTATTLTGPVTVDSSGVTSIGSNSVTSNNILFGKVVLDKTIGNSQSVAAGATANVQFNQITANTLNVATQTPPISSITLTSGLYMFSYITWWDVGGSAKTTTLSVGSIAVSSSTPSNVDNGATSSFYYATDSGLFLTSGGITRLQCSNAASGTRNITEANLTLVKLGSH